ncbi:hypothetical protein DSECCO2_334320 [anaerobic digester metagenome]
MAMRQYSDLLLMGFLTILTVVFIKTPGLNLLDFLLMAFIPGYCLMAAVFPGKNDVKGVERGALSLGLSLALTALIGFVMKYTPWGFSLTSTLLAVSAFTVVMVALAFVRRWRAGEEEGFSLNLSLNIVRNHFRGRSLEYRVLSVIIIITMVLAVSATLYIMVNPHQGDKFTEFYILGENGTAADYPTNLTLGETGNLTIGIVNHEYQRVDYLLVVKSNNRTLSSENLTLENGAKLEIPYNFTASSADKKEMKFLLYRLPDEEKVYRSLNLTVYFE